MQGFLNDVLHTIVLFLPAYFANMAPVLLVRTRLFKWWGKPIDAGKKLWGERIFGKGKTYFGIIAAMIGGVVGTLLTSFFAYVVFCVSQGNYCNNLVARFIGTDRLALNLVVIFSFVFLFIFSGLLIGLGAILGDLVKSFFKRRFRIKSGKPWIPFDQIDFVVGAWVAIVFIYPNINWNYFYIALILTPLLHLLANIIAYKLKLKKVWW
jgi:CDP-2,3-bis-(O-geranylgeranyl)-sn-glycerol synthase